MKYLIVGCFLSGLVLPAWAATESPYAGQEGRNIKALSSQQVENYLKGRGLGYARAAELNQYPGPRHVLDLAEQLGLSDEQIARSRAIFAAMQEEAIELGRQLVEKERALDHGFAAASIDENTLRVLVSEIGQLDARIRYVHLNAHLQQRALLTSEQVDLYDQLRGYGAADDGEHDRAHH